MKRVRPLALIVIALLFAGTYAFWSLRIPPGETLTAHLTRSYAWIAIGLIYLSLLVSPLYAAFPRLKYRAVITLLRRPVGVGGFFAALTHASFAFFGELGGFKGLPFLNFRYLLAISFSTAALMILFLLAATSFNWAVAKLGKKWKMLHRMVYLAGILITVHALLLGSDFADLSAPLPTLCYVLLGILLVLEGIRFDRWLFSCHPRLPSLGMVTLIVVALVAYAPHAFHVEGSGQTASLNVHAEHQQIALQNQASTVGYDTSNPALAGLRGDRTKRYTVSFEHSTVSPNQPTNLSFEVYDAASGNPVISYSTLYSKLMHLVIVDTDLQYYSHIHPTVQDNRFVVSAQFPHSGRYHLYVNYQPFGAIEQQQGFTLDVGAHVEGAPSSYTPDFQTAKVFSGTTITAKSDGELSSNRLSRGEQEITFNLTNTATGQPRTDLTPYLASFGHLVMINTSTYEYVHVHPSTLTIPKASDLGGPQVTFLPLGLYETIKPGTYRLFAQFQPAGQLITADFTATVR